MKIQRLMAGVLTLTMLGQFTGGAALAADKVVNAVDGADIVIDEVDGYTKSIDKPLLDYGVYSNDSSVTVNGDAKWADSVVVLAENGSRVVINGDVENQQISYKDGSVSTQSTGSAIHADDSIVIVNTVDGSGGNVIAQGYGVFAENHSTVTVDGDISTSRSDDSSCKEIDARIAIYADNSTVSAGGNIDSETNGGIYATNDSKVDVKGDVSSYFAAVEAESGSSKYGANVSVGGSVSSEVANTIVASDSTVSVGGDVYAGIKDGVEQSAIMADNSTVTIGSDNKTAAVEGQVHGVNGSDITVNGDVVSNGKSALYADDSEITVSGNVKGPKGVALSNGSSAEIGGSVSAIETAVNAADSDLQVGGNVSSSTMSAIQAKVSNVSVEGKVSSYGDKFAAVNADSSTVEIAGEVDANYIAILADNSSVSVGNNKKSAGVSSNAVGIIAENGSDVAVYGDVVSESADKTALAIIAEDSTVEIHGDVSSTANGIGAEDSTLTVDGDISAAEVAVDVLDSEVKVTGAIESSSSAGVIAENSTITADSISAYKNAVEAKKSDITINKVESSNEKGIIAVDSEIEVGEVASKDDALTVSNTDNNGKTATVNGNVTSKDGNGVNAGSNASVMVYGDVISESNTGVAVKADGVSTVIVGTKDGHVNVKSGFTAVEAAENGTCVSVYGKVDGAELAVDASDGARVEVLDDVHGDYDAVKASGTCTYVFIDGNVNADNYTGIQSFDGAEVKVAGDVFSGSDGIIADGTSTVTVDGSVYNTDDAAVVIMTGTAVADGIIIVGNAIESENGGAFFIADKSGSANESEILASIPEIIVFEVNCADTEAFVEVSSESKLDAADAEKLAEDFEKTKVNYIIRTDAEHGTIKIVGAVEKEGYFVANEDDVITLVVTVDDGYKLTGFDCYNPQAVIKSSGENSYDVTIPQGGGVDLKALFELLVNTKPEPKPEPKPEQNPEQNPAAGSTSGNGTNHKAGTVKAGEETVSLQNTQGTGVYIAIVDEINGNTVNEKVTQLEDREKFAGLTDKQISEIKEVDGGNLAAIDAEIPNNMHVVASMIRFEAEEAGEVIVYCSRSVADCSALYMNTETGMWEVIEVSVDAATGLISFIAPASGLVTLIEA